MAGIAEASATAVDAKFLINDESFMDELKELKKLRSFLTHEAVSFDPGPSFFNVMQFSRSGRLPDPEQWTELEGYKRYLFGLLTEPLRRKFLAQDIPRWLSIVTASLVVLALVSLAWAVNTFADLTVEERGGNYYIILPYYLFWLLSLGAIGAIAFIVMNALSVQQDATFDLSNQQLMILRIVVGALFGLVLTLPFGFAEFVAFVKEIKNGSSPDTGHTEQAILLLLPFVLGFSTSLVIMILNKLMDGVQAFFGRGKEPREPADQNTVTTPGDPARTR